MLRRWKRLRTTTLRKNPWWTYNLDAYSIPDGITGEYHYVHTNGSSMIIPITDEGEIILVNQYRYLCERESLEFPCGSVKDGADHHRTAAEELLEETGFNAGTLEVAGKFNPYNGVTDEICRVFIARDLSLGEAKPDATEEFELHRLIPDCIDALIADNTIWDGMTLAAWTLARTAVLGILS